MWIIGKGAGAARRAVGILSVSAIIVLSPVILIFVRYLIDADWNQLSDVGQAYGFVSALLSAAALFTVARSINLQTRQERLGHMQAFRAMQGEITRMVLDHPDRCRVGLGCDDDADVVAVQKNFFTTFQARYWLAGLEAGEFDEWLVRHEFAVMLFKTREGRDWWRGARYAWIREGVPTIQIRFSGILDEVLVERETDLRGEEVYATKPADVND